MGGEVCQETYNRVIHSKDQEIIKMVYPQKSMFLRQLQQHQTISFLYLMMPNAMEPGN
jgi:hypothetical protein